MAEEGSPQDNVFANEEINNSTSYDAEDTWRTVRTYWELIAELLNAAVCIANLLANMFMIYIVIRFKRLQTRPNFYVLNIAIADIVYLIFNTVLSLMLWVYTTTNLPDEFYCFSFVIEESSVFSVLLFACTTALDWCLVNYHEKLVQLHLKLYKFAIALIYLITFIRFIVIAVSSCVHEREEVFHLLYVTYLIILIILSFVNILKCRRPPVVPDAYKTKYSIIVANIVVLSWMPLFLYYLLIMLSRSVLIWEILGATMFIPNILSNSNMLVLLYVLGRRDKYFKMAYGRAFKRKLRNYENDDLDRDSEDEAVVENQVDVLPESLNTDPTTVLLY